MGVWKLVLVQVWGPGRAQLGHCSSLAAQQLLLLLRGPLRNHLLQEVLPDLPDQLRSLLHTQAAPAVGTDHEAGDRGALDMLSARTQLPECVPGTRGVPH